MTDNTIIVIIDIVFEFILFQRKTYLLSIYFNSYGLVYDRLEMWQIYKTLCFLITIYTVYINFSWGSGEIPVAARAWMLLTARACIFPPGCDMSYSQSYLSSY